MSTTERQYGAKEYHLLKYSRIKTLNSKGTENRNTSLHYKQF